MRIGRPGLIVLTAAGALAVLAPSAWAGRANDVLVEAAHFSTPNAGGAGDTVGCPDGQRVTGGGAGAVTHDNFNAYLDLSGPLGEGGDTAGTNTGDIAISWSAFVDHNAPPLVFKVFALCSATSDATVVAQSISLDNGSTGVATAQCPDGSRALGGGVGTTGPEHAFRYSLLASGPVDHGGTIAGTRTGDVARAWFGAIDNEGMATYTFKVFALCSADSHATVMAKSVTVKSGKNGSANAKCPSGTRGTGGGIGAEGKSPKHPNYFVMESGPRGSAGPTAGTGDGDVARSWFAKVFNGGPEDSSRTFKTFAICEPN